ncbi:MAG TPA: hypothetical protein VMU56_09840 [Beijerinckiaceae bacterium]|nr:hypothetical protein [Beijerinckiaceae bacterium]
MSKIMKSLVILAVGGGFALSLAGVANAGPQRVIDPSSLTPRERAEFYRAPLGDTGPFGEPVQADCMWSRLQVPTAQGLRWEAIEECGSGGRF